MNTPRIFSRLISVAPMMDYTDRHARYFLRLIAPDVLLYTEMVTAQALWHGDTDYLLGFDAKEHPLVLQLGGSDAKLLAHGAQLGERYGYDEINLNVGCPSSRVQSGRFGACLMREPELVAECLTAMQARLTIPVTVKCRIGVDEWDDYQHLKDFVTCIKNAGCQTFIIHARKAWLKGLSPKQNREIPPLRYDVVHQLKNDFPELRIIINGGIKTLPDVTEQLRHIDGVMIGRAAYANPYLLHEIQSTCFPKTKLRTRSEIISEYIPYFEQQCAKGVKPSTLIRPLLGLFQGEQGAALWRRHLSEHGYRLGALAVRDALALCRF